VSQKAQIVAFSKALGTYRLDVGEFPTTEQGLNALMARPADNATKWNGPYLEKAIPLDPWGHPYLYRAPGTDSEFDVVSYGKDGQPGGTDDASDITSY